MSAKRVYHYRIDFEGRIFHGNSEITDAVSIRQLIGRVRHDEAGRPYALCMGEWMMLEPDDVIHVIQDFEDLADLTDPTRLGVRCQAGLRRRVDLTQLRIRDQTYLYAPMEDGALARFGRRAAMTLAEGWMEPSGPEFVLAVGGRRIPIRGSDEGEEAGGEMPVAPPQGRR